jgi:putative ABC transport system permease protein
VARVTSFSAMAYVPRTAGARPVQAMAIEGGFPYYGIIETSPPDCGRAWAKAEACSSIPPCSPSSTRASATP